MKKFSGFTPSETFTPIPDSFCRDLLSKIDDLDELKASLYALWRIGKMEGPIRFLRATDFTAVLPAPEAALEKAVGSGLLVRVEQDGGAAYFLNSPRGRAAAQAHQDGRAIPEGAPGQAPMERPNLFKRYEQNIGPLTPLIADMLKDAEQTYSEEFVIEALEIAVKNNKRNWRYVEAILKRWKEEGHAKKQTGRDPQEDGRRYTEGEYGDYIEH